MLGQDGGGGNKLRLVVGQWHAKFSELCMDKLGRLNKPVGDHKVVMPRSRLAEIVNVNGQGDIGVKFSVEKNSGPKVQSEFIGGEGRSSSNAPPRLYRPRNDVAHKEPTIPPVGGDGKPEQVNRITELVAESPKFIPGNILIIATFVSNSLLVWNFFNGFLDKSTSLFTFK